MVRFTIFFAFCSVAVWAQSAADVARQIQEAGLDPSECYRVIDLDFSRQDLRVYFTSGYVILARPVNGMRPGAVFSADTEGGDAELLLLPPVRSERLSLAGFTPSPNLNEHFLASLMLFTGKTGDELREKLKDSKRAPEMGALLADKWNGVMHNVASSFLVRLVQDTIDGARSEFFYMAVQGKTLGNFDVFVDPEFAEDILVGQLAQRKGAEYFNVWTSFASRARRKQTLAPVGFLPQQYRIEATLDPALKLDVTTRVSGRLEKARRAVAFTITPRMRPISAKVDGEPAELMNGESARMHLMNASGDAVFLVVTPKALDPAKPHEFEIHHEGNVVLKAGDQVYYVDSRATWYPRRGLEFSTYDVTFRYPKGLSLVAAGDIVEDRTEGETRITQRKSDTPMRVAGFNLGDYSSVSVTHEPYRVTVYANRQIETALRTSKLAVEPAPDTYPRRRAQDPIARAQALQGPPPAPDPQARLKLLAGDVSSAMEFYAKQFGPPPMQTLKVSPIPATFGQGFCGLLFLSTLAYLDPEQRPAKMQYRFLQTFYSELLDAHETAHQWWGNLVISASYQDSWLMEALANYSALMFIEKKKGAKAMDAVLEEYRNHLLAKQENGNTLESAGPITWGYRLQSSLTPEAWHAITYEKGTWVIHMLRRKMGDEAFLKLLRTVCERYRFKPISTGEFRDLAGDKGNFFDTWVYGTGIPAIKVDYSVRGLNVTGTVTQTGVSDDFTASIPIEVQTGRQRVLHWVTTSSDPETFTIPLKAPPVHVGLAAKDALVIVKK